MSCQPCLTFSFFFFSLTCPWKICLELSWSNKKRQLCMSFSWRHLLKMIVVKGKETLIFIRCKDKWKKEHNRCSHLDPLNLYWARMWPEISWCVTCIFLWQNETCKMMCPGENGSFHLVHTVQWTQITRLEGWGPRLRTIYLPFGKSFSVAGLSFGCVNK